MKIILSLIAFSGIASAFNASLQPHRRKTIALQDASSPMETFERAVECAENYGYCNLDELEELSKGKLLGGRGCCMGAGYA